MFDHWRNYLSIEDIEKIESFVTDTRHGISRDKMLVFYGTGNNGKSTLLREIMGIVGKESVSKFDNDTSPDEIINKKLIYIEDVEEELIDNTMTIRIKEILSRSTIRFRELCTDKIIKCRITGNIIYVTNKIPTSVTNSLQRRIDIIQFNHVF